MAAFIPKGRKTYSIEPTIPGVGRMRRMSTRQRDKRLAGEMEQALRTLAMRGWRDLVVAVDRGDLDLIELWQAYTEGEQALARLRSRRGDTLLEDAVALAREQTKDDRAKQGYSQLLEYAPGVEADMAKGQGRAPDELRLSWLLSAPNVSALYERAERDRGANSVRRSLHRAVSDLLNRRFGRSRMKAVMADVLVPSAPDERREFLSPEEATKALRLADDAFRPVLGLALTTGIDRGPILRAQARDYSEDVGMLRVRDTKNVERGRTLHMRGVPLLENGEYWLRQMVAAKKPGDALTALTKAQMRRRWDTLRTKLGRKDLRWKDLRGSFATWGLVAGIEPREMQAILGHRTMHMTTRYLRRVPGGNRDALRKAALRYGLPGERSHLKVEDGSA